MTAFIFYHKIADSSVTISQKGERFIDSSFECGKEVVLSCQAENYTASMSWQNESSTIPLAECFFDICNMDPDVTNEYNFTADTDTGTFNLTFNATSYHNGTTYKCEIGQAFQRFLFIIKGTFSCFVLLIFLDLYEISLLHFSYCFL